AICLGERSVHRTPGASGSPAVRTSSTACRFAAKGGSDSTFFFPPAAPPPHPPATAPVRHIPDQSSAANSPEPRRYTPARPAPTAAPPRRRNAAHPSPITSAKTPATALQRAARIVPETSLASLPLAESVLPWHRTTPPSRITVFDSYLFAGAYDQLLDGDGDSPAAAPGLGEVEVGHE